MPHQHLGQPIVGKIQLCQPSDARNRLLHLPHLSLHWQFVRVSLRQAMGQALSPTQPFVQAMPLRRAVQNFRQPSRCLTASSSEKSSSIP